MKPLKIQNNRDQAFVLLIATELSNAVKRSGVRGAENLLREAILRAGLDIDFALRNDR
jgi:hypothetical protein